MNTIEVYKNAELLSYTFLAELTNYLFDLFTKGENAFIHPILAIPVSILLNTPEMFFSISLLPLKILEMNQPCSLDHNLYLFHYD